MRYSFFLLCLCSQLVALEQRPLGLTSLTVETPQTKLKPTAEIPKWLDGTLVRNGPALFNIGQTYVPHWFDGLAMLHAFRFAGGQVVYQNRFLRSSAYEKMVVEKSLDFPGFGQSAGKQEVAFIPNANINVATFAGKCVALTEIPLPVIFDLETLDTIGRFHYQDTLPKAKIWECAHPHTDQKTGDVINYHVQFFPEAKYVIYTMKKGSSAREVLAEIPVTKPAYMHSFALTEHYVILVEFPLFIDPQDILKGGSFSSHYKWEPSKQMRILVVDRQSKELCGQYLAEPVFAWHHINSYEDKGSLVIDMAAYSDARTFTHPEDNGDTEQNRMARFVRYTVNLDSKKVVKEQVGPSVEMPRINYNSFNGKPYNYVYGYDDTHDLEGLKRRGLVKIDTKTKHSILWSLDGCIADEPVFVARPGAITEDDGVLLACVLDTNARKSFLLILDAKKYTEIARVELPHHIPYGLHGDYLRSEL